MQVDFTYFLKQFCFFYVCFQFEYIILKGISWWDTPDKSAKLAFLIRTIINWILHSMVTAMVYEILRFCITKILLVIKPVVLYDKGQYYLNRGNFFCDSLLPIVNTKQKLHHSFWNPLMRLRTWYNIFHISRVCFVYYWERD